MSRQSELPEATGMKVYFVDPQSPWRMGNHKNTNGFLCEYFPRGSDLTTFDQEKLNAIEHPAEEN